MNYKTIEEEMISRAPHTHGGILQPTFASDNKTVADILTSIVNETNAQTRVKGITRACY